MRGSKTATICISVLLAIATLLEFADYMAKVRTAALSFPGDLRLRYNESLCAHKGVNPFHVWNQDTPSSEFRGWPKSDDGTPGGFGWGLLAVDKEIEKKLVHAYTPWHMAFTWFYGNISFSYVVAFIYLLYGFALAALSRTLKDHCWETGRNLFWAFALFCLAMPVVYCLRYGNYGIICAGLLLCMITLLDRHEVLAGVCWGLMMAKPQVAALLVFPLLFRKKFVTIAVAALMCALGTLFTSCVYGESPLDLILQVPQIGAPYDTSPDFAALMPPSLYHAAKHCWTAVCVAACAYCSWLWRDAKDPAFRFAPIALFFPVWLYSSRSDHIAAWPYVLLVLSLLPRMFSMRNVRWFAWAYIACSGLVQCFGLAWSYGTQYGVFSPTGIGWIYRAVMCSVATLHVLFGVFALSKRPSFWER